MALQFYNTLTKKKNDTKELVTLGSHARLRTTFAKNTQSSSNGEN